MALTPDQVLFDQLVRKNASLLAELYPMAKDTLAQWNATYSAQVPNTAAVLDAELYPTQYQITGAQMWNAMSALTDIVAWFEANNNARLNAVNRLNV